MIRASCTRRPPPRRSRRPPRAPRRDQGLRRGRHPRRRARRRRPSTSPRGQFTAIMGPSGSGKSTLMHCLAGLDRSTVGPGARSATPTSARSTTSELTQLRRDQIGFVFQAFNLVPTLTALENITLPMDIAGRKPDQAWLDKVIDTVGLRDRLSHRPSELSGGQQQRVACARALASRPEIDLRRRADRQPRLARGRRGARASCAAAVDDLGQTIVMVTHDPMRRRLRRPRRCSSPTAASSTRWPTRPPSASSTA